MQRADPQQERLSLEELVRPRRPLPPFDEWTIQADCAFIIVSHILRERPRLVVELGSGLSTLLIAYALEQTRDGKFISIEHDQNYLAQTQQHLRQHGVEKEVQLLHCQLEPCILPEGRGPWYRLPYEQIADDSIDFLIIDGPPGYLCRQSRYPALPKLWDKLSPQAVVMLDDGARDDEKAIVERWLAQFEGLEHEYIATRKGLSVFRRR